MQIYPPSGDTVSEFMRQKYEREARRYWDLFYKRNEGRFFKDRHYLHKEWGHLLGATTAADVSADITADVSNADSAEAALRGGGAAESGALLTAPKEDVHNHGKVDSGNGEKTRMESRGGSHSSVAVLADDKRVVLEVGCGAGNTVYPLLQENPAAFIYACDFSARAVELVKAHPSYDAQRVHAFVCDITEDDLSKEVPAQSADIVSMIFVLSAISPEKMPAALLNVAHVLKPGGHVLLRDYAEGDLAQERLTGKVQKLADNFYVRGDGTRAYYFSEEALLTLFRGAGLECTDIRVHERELENRARKVVMNRRWIQGTFQKAGGNIPSTALPLDPRDGVSRQLETCTIDSEKPLPANRPNTTLPHSTALAFIDLEGSSRKQPLATNGAETTVKRSGRGKHCRKRKPEPDFARRGSRVQLKTTGGPRWLRELAVAGRTFRYRALSNEHQHTQPSTGLLLWDSARVLAEFLAAHPQIIAGRHVLEVGCGGIALPSTLSAERTGGVVATDGDAAAMELLDANITLNADAFELSKLRAERLRWGHSEDIARVRGLAGPHGYDVIIGADVVYVKEAVPLLFQTAAALLARDPSQETAPDADVMLTPPLLLLCHVIRRVAEGDILEAARQAGFEHHRFVESPEGRGAPGAIRLLALRRTPCVTQSIAT
ncbi:hypothetical protein KFL_000560310 [Klebsormidium nitens]|uniref:Methyltransferase type 12 domain-containing protein n=1 Tax=Klebsormidium nitens TaxID=105231 RepID=A0A1Y1HRV3_KLENI|nr:hypothetical protein KFL_000560310 [Klebsormidium nitens]|eukprot:GAQ80542.1 hypothetical protein KFL_000560310 [Klebsormidium nitens]